MRLLPAVLAGALAAAAEPTPPGPSALRYDLAAGDHIVFRSTLVREGRGESSWSTRSTWETHVVVLARDGDLSRVGIQRNRVSMDVTSASGSKAERERFARTVAARPAVLTEVAWLDPTGRSQIAASAVREENSELLTLVSELMPLPPGPPTGTVAHDGEDCQRLDRTEDAVRLRVDFCPGSGLPAHLEVKGHYPAFPGLELQETLTVDRVGRTRGERAGAWLKDPKARLALLDLAMISPALPVPAADLWPLLDGDEDVKRRVLGAAYRHRLDVPRERLDALARGESAVVRRLAGRFASPPPGTLPPPPPPRLVAVAQAVRGTAPIPEWACQAESDRPAMMAAAQRARGQVPGPTVAAMRTEGFAGWPYVLDVPEDYRGDEPRPLLIVLGGGAGVAIRTAATIHPAVAHEGWLVVSPHAAGLWWDGRAPEMVKALLAELLRDLNVDTDRVYVAGSSNGGAGAVLFPALMPDRFAAAAPLMAVGLEPMGDRFPSVAGLGHIPWMFVHGADDMPSRSQSIVDGLKRADPRARAELHVLPGRGHDIRIGSDDGWTLPFLEKQVRERFPRRVRIRSREPVRVFWAEVIEKEGGLAEVDGTIEGDVVTLTTRRVRSLRVRLRREYLGGAAAVRIVVNGREAYAGPFSEDCRLMAESWRATGDPHLAHSWEHTIDGLK